ncbi:MAG TPA: acyl-CoA dehydrogenase family protein [Usitatibacter sp.]|jgi:acyl-CoA dehydrogenase|nr:acyl-CoA dehydrogenase family protein [Usitatibacter sp.]
MNLARRSIQPAAPRDNTFDALIDKVHAIGRDVIAPLADEVDRDARFPREAFDALKAEKLLSAYVPVEFGGQGLSIGEISKICETLGAYCASTAMIYAMHQIQVACIVHHGLSTPFFRDYVREIVARQHLVASATTEMGIGGDVRSSICAVKVVDNYFMLEKQAPVISYGAYADAILVTCRRCEDAPRNDQVMVLVRQDDCTLKQLSVWDTLGFRGTCSPGFELKSIGKSEQIFPVPYGEIHSQTQHPVAHILWASLWLGLAGDAMGRARQMVRNEARKTPGTTPISATRLAEADLVFTSFRGLVFATLSEYERLIDANDTEAFSHFGFAVRVNNLKLSASQMVLELVTRAMVICGIQGYRNDSKLTLGRHLRDAMGASLMVNNDRILGQNATMHVGLREAS